jgi:hypothetical protein
MHQYTDSPPAVQPFSYSPSPAGQLGGLGGSCAATATHASDLPCLSSNFDIESFNYCRKQAHCVRENIERFVRDISVNNIGFLTLTFPDNLLDPKQAYQRFKSFNANFLGKSELFGQWICVKERQTRGAWHYHLLIDCKADIKTGFNWDKFDRKDYTEIPPYLRQIWRVLRDMLPRYGFGRHELTPVRKNAQAISHYMAKYLYKGFINKRPEDKHIKLYTSSRKQVTSVPKFSWLTDNSRQWRKNVKLLANFVLRSDDYYSLQDYYGKNWAFHLREEIIDLHKIMRLSDLPF